MQDDDLDHLLAEAARRTPLPSPALMERVLADGFALQPAAPALPPATRVPRGGFLGRLAAAFGGTPAMAGLCSAAVLGVAVGYLSPATFDTLIGTADETAEFFPEAELLATEG
jgi:hypothetical protein